MSFLESIKIALYSLKANKLRSFLTMLGIIIGVSAVITITTIGHSIETMISREFSSIGMNVLLITQWYNDNSTDKYESFVEFTDEMINDFVKKNKGFHQMVNYSLMGLWEDDTTKNSEYIINVFNYGFYKYSKYEILEGRGFSEDDFVKVKNVCLITEDFAKNYFKDDNPLGKTIDVNTKDGLFTDKYVVIGVYKPKNLVYSEMSLGEENNTIVIPSETITPLYELYNPIKDNTQIMFYYDETVDANLVTEIAREYFDKYNNRETIEITYVNSNETLIIVTTVISVVTIGISFIAAIALIVGGVGVMNIMLVSVIERTKEIGIEKSLGAKNRDIKRQFLIESMTICFVGSTIGILIGLVNGYLLSFVVSPMLSSYIEVQMTFSVTPSITAIIISTIFSSLIGVFFGLYPANKAAKLNPIDALRYE